MNLVFAGTPEFAVPTLEAVIQAGHRVLAAYTQPERPTGRGRKRGIPSAVKQAALRHGLIVYQPQKLSSAEQELRALAPEAMIVVAYGQILQPAILAIPKHGCINVHASLLPRWRGAAPIARALEAGDSVSGVTIMRMDAGLDTGPILARAETPMHEHDNSQSLHDRLAALGAQTLVAALARLARGEIDAQPQPNEGACYASKLRKEEAVIDWHQPALTLHRKIRAFNPYPVACTEFRGRRLRLWDVGAIQAGGGALPGTVLGTDDAGIQVQTGDGTLVLTRLQAEGGKVLDARDFVNGSRVRVGDRFAS